MALARFERDFTDEEGNLLTGNVTVEVRRMTGGLPQLYSDRDGAVPLGNSFVHNGGRVAFHVAGGSYRITVTQGEFSRELTYVAIGLAGETDLQIATPQGAWDNAATYARGDLVTHPEGEGMFISLQDSNLNHEPDDGTPGDTAWWMYLGAAATGPAGPQGEQGEQGEPGDQGPAGADGTDPGVLLTWDDENSDANPGAGNIRANNDALGSATVLYVSKTNRAGDDISAFLAALDDSTNTVKGQVTLTRSTGNAQAGFNVTGITDATGYVKVAVSGHWGATGFLDGNAISFQFSRSGDKGTDGLGAGDMQASVYDPQGIEDDAFDRANHTGTQAISTITGLQTALDGLQPLDSDLTAIAALGTTTFGRSLLALANAAAAKTELAIAQADVSGLTTADTPTFTGVNVGNADTTLARSAAGVVTVEGTVLLKGGRQEAYIPASSMYPRATSGAGEGTYDSGSNDLTIRTLDFDTTTQEYAQFEWAFPKSWDRGTVTFVPYWTNTGGSSTQTVVWSLAGVAISDDDTLNATMGTAQTSSDTWIAQNDLHIGPESSAITIGGSPAEADLVVFQVSRVVGSDNMSGDAVLIGIKVFYSLDKANDA